MFSKLNFGIVSSLSSLSLLLLLGNNFDIVSSWTYGYCDNEYNDSSCANTTLTGAYRYKCRGFMSCADSTVDTIYDLFCQGDRSCKDLTFDNGDNDELFVYGYQSGDSMTITGSTQYVDCYGYQSCLDSIFAQTTTDNDAEAYGYQSMYNAYVDYSDSVISNGYQSLYYTTINTTTVSGNELDVTVYGYYGSYETDILCQDGITCNFYAYGYYATEETYLYCKPGAECNVYCGDVNGCVGMNLYCYSTATCYFDCDDATECPTESDAYSVLTLAALTKEEKSDGKKRYTDDEFDRILEERLHKKYEKQYEYKQERLREEKAYKTQSLKQQNDNNELVAAPVVSNNNNNILESPLIESVMLTGFGMFIGIIATYSFMKCMAKKEYQYQSIV